MRLQKTNVKWCMLAAFMLVLAPTVSGAMHIMEGFLPVKWAVIWYVLFIPFFVVGLKNITKVVKRTSKEKIIASFMWCICICAFSIKNTFCNRKLLTSNRGRTSINIIWT